MQFVEARECPEYKEDRYYLLQVGAPLHLRLEVLQGALGLLLKLVQLERGATVIAQLLKLLRLVGVQGFRLQQCSAFNE
jgi:hypothetical protein